ncbi:site-specific DNA-methyltransferase [Mannheimia sp. AT1]|uniref:Site-specific DNA-methyltransferase n=1 Tax=Mannheimia cairinae TaxID=3025936 RepID=A0ABT5MP82_9PAST|nr:site-specific DNA-methyltransferase [Mannheimia cairinae]MDD0823798.1 site-specific DNA-methyltransferase [Mannheimia cairinae]
MATARQLGENNANVNENLIIQGDNLAALKSLLPFYAGQVKCIYIDPPYNTGNAFENYDDNLENSIWYSLMYPRLELLHSLLKEDGFFCCQIDDSQSSYLKIILDEIFGRDNYLTTLYIKVRYPEKTLKEDMDFHKEVEQIHIYRKSRLAKPYLNKLDVGFEKFTYYINELSEPSKTIYLGGKQIDIFDKNSFEIIEKEGSEFGLKEIWASGTILDGNSSGRFFRDYLTGRSESDGLGVLYKVYGIGDDNLSYRYFTGPKKATATKGKYYQGVPKNKLNEETIFKKIPINSFYDFAANFGNCRQEGDVGFRGGKKPEILIRTLLGYFSNEGDIILDSFLGSGTTVAVAHKMNRRYIGIEIGQHAKTHVVPRLKKVIEGEQGGISQAVNWQGGGAFRFCELGETIFDEFGSINSDIDFEALAAHIWYLENRFPLQKNTEKSPLVGIHNGKAYYLLYNGILGDKTVNGGNVLTSKMLKNLPHFDELLAQGLDMVIYGEGCRLMASRLAEKRITFKHIPHDVSAQ